MRLRAELERSTKWFLEGGDLDPWGPALHTMQELNQDNRNDPEVMPLLKSRGAVPPLVMVGAGSQVSKSLQKPAPTPRPNAACTTSSFTKLVPARKSQAKKVFDSAFL